MKMGTIHILNSDKNRAIHILSELKKWAIRSTHLYYSIYRELPTLQGCFVYLRKYLINQANSVESLQMSFSAASDLVYTVCLGPTNGL